MQKNLGNVSKKGTENIIVWTLFNKNKGNSKMFSEAKQETEIQTEIEHRLRKFVSNHNRPGLVHEIKTLVYRESWAF